MTSDDLDAELHRLRIANAGLSGLAEGLLNRAMTAEWERDQLRAGLTREEVWSAGPDAQPMPTLITWDGQTYARDALGDPYPFEPTEEQMRAAGWKKQARWIGEWEDVE